MTPVPKKKPSTATRKRPDPIPLVREVGGKEWTFFIDVNEIIDIEKAVAMSIGQILQQPLSMSFLIEALIVGLRDADGNAADRTTATEFFKETGITAVKDSFATQINRVFGD